MSTRDERRNSGIVVVGELPWGSHFCQFYRTKQDLIDVVVPYFRAGLESGEACVWVTSDFLTKAEALAAMVEAMPDLSEFLDSGQMEVFTHNDWYLKGGKFDLQRTLDMWMEKHDRALEKGFAGLRVTGNPYWIESKKDWDDFAAYEAEINRVIGDTRLLVLCTYSLEKCSVGEILDVVKNHEFALSMDRGAWQVIRLPVSSFAV